MRVSPLLLRSLYGGLSASAGEVRSGALPALAGGTRAAAVAGAGCADPAGAEAVAGNPAGIVRQRHSHFIASYADLYGLGLVHHTEIALTLPGATLGPSGLGLRYLDLAGFDTEEGGPGDPAYSELSLSFAQARAFGRVSLGISARLETARGSLEEEEDVEGNGAALDLGMLYRLTDDLRCGLLLRDAVSAAFWSAPGTDTVERRPLALTLGLAHKDLLPGLRLLADLETGEERATGLGGFARRVAFAAEWHGFDEELQLRGGCALRGNEEELRRLYAGGFLLRIDSLELQYAVTLDDDALGTTHRFGLGIQWD
jgi:hypothetical protein